ncbi:MAG: signal peptidase I, partial [Acidobacteriota bacterium]
MAFVREAADWAAQIVVLIFATSTIAMPYIIPSGSMEGTLMTGDHLIVDKLAYAPHDGMASHLLPYSDVKRGDIIVFRYPPDIRQTFIKRVIGIPGDRLHLENGVVVRNGVRLNEPYVQHIATSPENYRDNFPAAPDLMVKGPALAMLRNNVRGGELVVPPGQYFAMGDNRDNSSDSRYWGFVPRENITGKPLLVYWS